MRSSRCTSSSLSCRASRTSDFFQNFPLCMAPRQWDAASADAPGTKRAAASKSVSVRCLMDALDDRQPAKVDRALSVEVVGVIGVLVEDLVDVAQQAIIYPVLDAPESGGRPSNAHCGGRRRTADHRPPRGRVQPDRDG